MPAYPKDFTRYSRDVEYDAMLAQVSGIDTVNEIFRATVDLEMHYMVTREDVVRSMCRQSWEKNADV